MSNDIIFWTQIASVVTVVLSVFGLYRLLVDQKDATIQLLKETISSLKDQLAEARSSTPDVLAQSLSNRVKLLQGELARLSNDNDSDRELVREKEEELRATRHKAEELAKQVAHAQHMLNDFLCPHCRAPLMSRDYNSEMVEYRGRELDIDHDYSVYECGYAELDGTQSHPCGGHTRIKSAVIGA